MQSEKVINHIVHWLKTYAKKAKMDGFVIGISGGVDSAVVSTLAAKTGMKTLLLEMPILQKTEEMRRAKEHIEDLQNRFDNVVNISTDLTDTFQAFSTTIERAEKGKNISNKDLALANTRSRLRMLTLYYFGQTNNLLVAGTGNKIEDFGIGFFTKYGDGGVDISPIADLTKTQVFELSQQLNLVETIQNAIPTDGLWNEEKTDEQQIGATYPELEWAMSVYEYQNTNDLEGRKKEVFEIYDQRHKAARHKIEKIPVCEIPENYLT